MEHVCPWSGPAPTTFTHVTTFFSLLTTEVVSLAAVFSIVRQKWLRGRLHNFRPCLKTFIAPFPPTRLTTPGSPRVTHPLRLLLVILLRGYSHSLLHSFREKLFSTDTSTHFLKIMKTWNWQTKIPHNKFDKRRNYCNS